MEKHIKMVAILNIVYRSFTIIIAVVLFLLSAVFGQLVDFFERRADLRPDDIPRELLDIVPVVLIVIGAIVLVVSIVAIIGSVGVMRRQEWARIVLIIVSFFNLIRVPLGTALGVYTLWVLLNDEIVRLFNPVPSIESARPPA